MKTSWRASLLLVFSFAILLQSSQAKIAINEIADKGSDGVCDGEDWIELYNTGEETISLKGYLLFDDGGPLDDKAFLFGGDVSIDSNGYLLLCCNGDGIASPAFKIGGDDVISLQDPQGEIVDLVALPDLGDAGLTYARSNDEEQLLQTTTPTPGATNLITAPLIASEPTVDDYRAQNAMGASFFGLAEDGTTLPATDYDPIIDLYVTVNETDWESLQSNPHTETYIPVQEFKTITSEGTTILSSPGRMRPRGQSTLVFPICMDSQALPFKLDFASSNASQTLFGVEEAYLRNNFGDDSQLREWSMHRMLAKFDLPYLRTRHVRFFVNDVQLGFYTFMEAADQDYVMARSYNYDAAFDENHGALYKVKTHSNGCGDDWLVGTASSSGEGPYAYERGDHRVEIPKLGDFGACTFEFFDNIEKEAVSVREDFTDSGYTSVDDCPEFLLKNDLIDRDMGKKEWNDPMNDFINTHLTANGYCQDEDCSTKRNIIDQIDVDNWLKNFAVYAVTANQDSPMGWGNNYYLASAGDSSLESPKWKIVQYDHNNDPETTSDSLCDPSCSARGVENWSIVRPTCRSLSENPLVGPLLLDEDLYARYLSYVREFTESIFTDESFLDELKAQYEAISTEDASSGFDATAFFDWMEKRGRSVLEQLDLLDKGEFPEFASLNSAEPCVGAFEEYDGNDNSICSSDDEAFLATVIAGFNCFGGALNGGSSIAGVTEDACVNGGGAWTSYTCRDANIFLGTDTTLDEGARQFLVENWWRPLCCDSKEGNIEEQVPEEQAPEEQAPEETICGKGKEVFANTNAGSNCIGGTFNDESSHTGVTKEACEGGGGEYVPYTCEEANTWVFTEGPNTFDEGTIQLLVEQWWQPVCCIKEKVVYKTSICDENIEYFADNNAGFTCTGGSLNDEDSNSGITEEECEGGGGVLDPYTCEDAHIWLNTQGPGMVDAATLQSLVEAWWQPKCCGSVIVEEEDEEDEDVTANEDVSEEVDDDLTIVDDLSSAPVLGQKVIVLLMMLSAFVFFG